MIEAKKHLIIGIDGFLGGIVSRRLADSGAKVTGTSVNVDREHPMFLDLASDVSRWTPPENTDVAFIFAAVTSLAACAKDPEGARLINVNRTIEIARRLHENGSFVIFPSTNLVFDGAIPATPASTERSPKTEYGRQKAEVEKFMESLGARGAVVRFTKIISAGGGVFQEWRSSLKSNTAISAFSDMSFSPVSPDFAAEALARIADAEAGGVYQASASDDITYEQAARMICSLMGAPPELVRPARASESRLDLEAIPAHTTLDTSRIVSEFGLKPKTAAETIEAVEW